MFLRCEFHSGELGMAVQANIILPQKMQSVYGVEETECEIKDIPVLYLLHGLSDDHSIWCRRTSIERYAADYNLAIVMPFAGRSFYADMKCGQKWWSFISEELPNLVESYFPVSRKRENTFVAGISMGGYGALKLALRNPEKFAAVIPLSAVADIAGWSQKLCLTDPARKHEMECIFGDLDKVAGSENDLFTLSEKLAASDKPKPAIFQICGTKDYLYEQNLKLKAHLEKINYEFKYFEEPGIHNWEFWDRNIQKILKWLPLKENMP